MMHFYYPPDLTGGVVFKDLKFRRTVVGMDGEGRTIGRTAKLVGTNDHALKLAGRRMIRAGLFRQMVPAGIDTEIDMSGAGWRATGRIRIQYDLVNDDRRRGPDDRRRG